MEKWYFINSGPCSGAYNMAMDEALLTMHSAGEIPPVIRFYEWAEPTLSIGYFQQAMKDMNIEAIRGQGIDFVRRPTGGRAVLHEHELTYSVIVSEKHPQMPKNVTDAYRVLSEGILKGFHHLGMDAYFSVPESKEQLDDLKKPKSAVCFDAPSWYELVVEGKKVAGSAQTRQKGVILQHGAILLDVNIDKLLSVFHFTSDEQKQRMRAKLVQKAVAINDLTDATITASEAAAAFQRGFEESLHIELVPYELTNEQLHVVEEIMCTKYMSDEWNFKK